MPYYTIENAQLVQTAQPPADYQPFAQAAPALLPPQITTLHEQLRAWQTLDRNPGPILPRRILIGPETRLAWHFDAQQQPNPLTHIGLKPTLAAWLILLDQVMETYVVIARARRVWSPAELAGALSFMTPAFLPLALLDAAPGRWQLVAEAVAIAVADGPLQDEAE